MTVSKDNEEAQAKLVKGGFPRVVVIIMLAEFCERFSYSGMRAFLTLYLRSKLGYSDEGATEIYHIFSTFVYFFPIIGGILADNYLGKFKTILYMMFIYAGGNMLVAVTAVPHLELPQRMCTIIGLLLITVGAGGIKPCVTAFGGDQFILPQQEKQLALYFSILYFNICTGSLIAKTVSPILRSEVHCFGDKDCYSLAFGAPGLVVLVSIVIFVSARNRYVMKKTEGNMVIDFVKCISLGIKNKICKVKGGSSHWLDSTEEKYDKRFLRDVKKTLSILVLFTALPMFWALLDQLGSRWTLQATKMDGRIGFITVKPDQLQVLGPICILILIPLSQKYIYPFLWSRSLLTNPLHRLLLGGVLAALAFVASALVEIYIKTTYPELPQAGFSQLRLFNGNPCSISIQNDQQSIIYTIPSLSHFTNKQISVRGTKDIRLALGGNCIEPREEIFSLEDNNAISFFITGNNIERFKENVDKSKSGLPVVRYYIHAWATNLSIAATSHVELPTTITIVDRLIPSSLEGRCNNKSQPKQKTYCYLFHIKYVSIETVVAVLHNSNGDTIFSLITKLFFLTERVHSQNVSLYNEKRQENEVFLQSGVSPQIEVFMSEYSIRDGDIVVGDNIEMNNGGVYIIIIDKVGKSYETKVVIITQPNSITMALLLPQFLIMSAAEVLFAVTGNEFAFKEAPESMKAVMTAAWLLTEAAGNLIIIVVTRFFVNYQQETQSFIYTGLMCISIIVFHFMSKDYQFGPLEEEFVKKERSNSEVKYHQVKQAEEYLDH